MRVLMTRHSGSICSTRRSVRAQPQGYKSDLQNVLGVQGGSHLPRRAAGGGVAQR